MVNPRVTAIKRIVFVATLCAIPWLVCSCAMVSNPPSMQHSCRGFDFDKKFPEFNKKYKFLSVKYDTNLKRMKNVDGLHFSKEDFVYPGWNSEEGLTNKRTEEELRILEWPMDPYNYCDMPLSEKEKKYIAAYDAREREFDRKYAGEIKEKLRKASILRRKTQWKRTVERLEYPCYLVGEELPPGLVTPASYFTADFMFEYIRGYSFDADGRLKKAPLVDFILASTPLNVGMDADFAGEIAYNAADGARDRLEAFYPEYVLTYYNLKEYKSAEERSQVVHDLAVYYSDVAFRGTAEAMYHYIKCLGRGQRCRIANYAASRVYDLIMEMESPEKLATFKQRYQENITGACVEVIGFPLYRKEKDGLITRDEGKLQRRLLRNKVIAGEIGCAND